VTFLLLASAGGAYLYRYHRLGYWGLHAPASELGFIHFQTDPPDAQVLLDGNLVTERPLKTRFGRALALEFRAPGRLTVVRSVSPLTQEVARISVQLPSAIAPLNPDAVYELPSRSATARSFTKTTELEDARKKLMLYEDCAETILRPVADSRQVFLRSAPTRLSRTRFPAVIPLPKEALSRCWSDVKAAEEYAGGSPALDKAAISYVSALRKLDPVADNLKRYIDTEGFLRDNFKDGRQMYKAVKREFRSSWTAQTEFTRALQAERLALQTFELRAQKENEGPSLHWHLRNALIASQEHALSLSVEKAIKAHAHSKEALRTALNGARDYALTHESEVKKLDGAEALLNAIPAVLNAEPTKGILWHNQGVELFNALVLR